MKLPLSTLKASFPILRNPANRHKAIALTPKQFHYALTNTLDRRQAAAVYERYHVPGPGRTLYQVSFANFTPHAATRVGYGTEKRAPLLLIAGEKDHTFPAPLTRSTFRKYHQSKAATGYKEFPDRSHYSIGEPGWENIADYALRWAMDNALDGT